MTKKKKGVFLKVTISVILIIMLTLTILGFFWYSKIDKEIDLSLIRTGASSVTRIYYFDYEDRKNRIGEAKELKEEELFLQKSEWSSIYDMPKYLIDAFIAIEDRRFFEHSGVDWPRTFKAFFNYIFGSKGGRFGGSTITQQLVKNLTGDNQTTAKRKIEEIFRAINLEKKLGKNEILELYLNVVYLSQNCYGVSAGANLYFNKDVSELTLGECAALASIVKSPTNYDPYLNIENNKNRRTLVLKAMLNEEKITEYEYNQAINEEIKINSNIENENKTGIYSWYTEALIDEVSEDLAKKYNIEIEYAKKMIMKGGLNIYSVIDPDLQKYVEGVYENYTQYVNKQNGTLPESACVILDPKTSDILAIVGGTGKKSANMIFNRATDAKRPLGSVMKPISVYAPALEENIINYAKVYDDTPLKMENGTYWPKNSPDRYRGLVPIYYAIEHSINTVAVKVLHDLRLQKALNYLDKFEISVDSDLDRNDSSIALGQLTNGESLLNITNAYCVFNNEGYISNPKTYLYVTDNYGNVILTNDTSEEKVISNDTAMIMTKMLQNVVENGTARNISMKEWCDVAGKTGTSSNNEDKWFIGYTPSYVCGVWTGYDIPKPMYYTLNPSSKIFDIIMTYANKNNDNKFFDNSFDIVEREFCYDSGMLPCDECKNDIRGSRVINGYFKIGNEPKEICNIHKEVSIDKTDGMIAKKFTPFWKKRKVSLLNYDRDDYPEIEILDTSYLIKSRKREE